MMHIFKKVNIGNIRTILQEVSQRFPLAMLLVVLTTGVLTYLVASENTLDTHTRTILLDIVISYIVSFFLSVSFSLFSESEKCTGVRRFVPQGAVVLFGIFFYYTLNGYTFQSIESAVFIFLTLAGFLSLLFVAPFIRRLLSGKYDQDIYYAYLYKMSLVFLISGIVGGALMLLGSIAIGSIFALFDLAFLEKEKIFMYWMIFSSALFSPIFALAHVPAKETFTKGKAVEHKFFTFLIKYIGVPFIYIYFLILYAYSIKVLMHFSEWPKGQISWMVIAFSIFGYKMYVFTHHLAEENSLIRLFRKFFPFAVIPQLLMLFYAIYLRIHQYDITMNRYFVVVFGIWLLGISLYYALSKKKYLGIIPFSMGIIILLISIGPWSVYSMPANRQYDKLVRNLETAHILQAGKIVPLTKYTDISDELSSEIHDGIDYVCDYSECSRIKKLFARELEAKEKESREAFEKNKAEQAKLPKENTRYRNRNETYPGLSSWEIVSTVSEAIKVKNNRYGNISIQKYLNFHTNYNDDFFPMRLDGYQYLVNITENRTTQSVDKKWLFIDMKKKELQINEGTKTLEAISLANVLDSIAALNNGTNNTTLFKEALTFDIKGAKFDTKLFIKNIDIPNPKYTGANDNTVDYSYTSGYGLIREK